MLSRGHADEAMAWTDRTTARLGLTLYQTKTRPRQARTERIKFLSDGTCEGGYSFCPRRFRQSGW